MRLGFVVKAGGAWLVGAGLVLAGAAAVLYFVGLCAWQYLNQLQTGVRVRLPLRLWFVDHSTVEGPNAQDVLRFVPEFPVQWVMKPDAWLPLHDVLMQVLNRVHAGIVFAVIGAGLILLGRHVMRTQRARFAYERRQEQDRLRRREEYRRVREPRLDPDAPFVPAVEQPSAAVFRTRTVRMRHEKARAMSGSG